jgi:hypothetical protein
MCDDISREGHVPVREGEQSPNKEKRKEKSGKKRAHGAEDEAG